MVIQARGDSGSGRDITATLVDSSTSLGSRESFMGFHGGLEVGEGAMFFDGIPSFAGLNF